MALFRFGKKARQILVRNSSGQRVASNKLCPIVTQDLCRLFQLNDISLRRTASFDCQLHRGRVITAKQFFEIGNRLIARINTIDG